MEKTSYASALRMTVKEKQAVTVQLIHTALEDIFHSIPRMPNSRLPDFLDQFTDAYTLTNLLVADGRVKPPKTVKCRQVLVHRSAFGEVATEQEREVCVLRSKTYLLGLAFDDCYDCLLCEVESLVREGFEAVGEVFNPYLTVEIEPHLTPRGQIAMMELRLGEDIRFIHYRNCFPDKRYDPDYLTRSCDV
ncbi:hypothetical protein GLN57_24825 [Shigella flexneri 2a]|uniref:hypothetical protein n=1 Tax=Shigella flexneri TaxID=623 RepID=UPI0012E80077|nr:hypothetical protein [Shigella flexneri]MUY36941.1 hypothetical protein [Shigella flexneri 2a]